MKNKIDVLLNTITNMIKARRRELVSLEADLDELRKAGMVNASVWMKDGTYMYLVYPVQGNEPRKREYIGINPERVARARARIERYDQGQMIKSKIDNINFELRQVEARLEGIDYLLRAKQASLWGWNNVE